MTGVDTISYVFRYRRGEIGSGQDQEVQSCSSCTMLDAERLGGQDIKDGVDEVRREAQAETLGTLG